MFLADRPGRYDSPGECIVIAGRHHDPEGGIQLDGILPGARGDMRLWMSYAGLQSIVRRFGKELNLATKSEVDLAKQARADSEAQLAQARDLIIELEAKLERINGVTKDGFKIVRQQGRPAAKKVAA